GPGVWDLLVDDSVANEVKVTWSNVRRFGLTANWSMSATLFASGEVRFDYSDGIYGVPGATQFVAISAGDGVGTGNEPSQVLAAGADSGSLELLYQNVWPSFDLPGTSLTIAPNGQGGYASAATCGLARHTAYGDGCYDVARESFYQDFPDSLAASNALEGNALSLTPTADGYTAAWLAGAAPALYVPPGASATTLVFGAGGQVTFPLTNSFPSPYGAVSAMRVLANGIFAFGSDPINYPGTGVSLPDPVGFLRGARGGIYCWHFYLLLEGGDVFGEEANGVVYLTFRDIENFPSGVVNPDTFQLQIDQATGVITLVFVEIDDRVSSPTVRRHLIGWTAPGVSLDPASIDLATQLPLTTSPDVRALELSAAPLPISTPSSGSTVVYSIENAIETAAGSSLASGLLVLSNGSMPALDLGFLGAGGCVSLLASPDLALPFTGPLGTQSVTFPVPPGVPAGVRIYAQAVSLGVSANSLGLLTSNGLESLIGAN
ncbi:MAG: hypothetical protein AB8H80_19330, partial [Planctomycetota bacterium]